jgi:alkylhydroperoxidase family enzyme
MLEYCVGLTVQPSAMNPAWIERLHEQGFDDDAIHDATQVAAYFNYINRIADGLGVDLEDFMKRSDH